uniref:SAP domain-containing ribonucleoprotein n=1 Tax=Mola mola TaxID=94237 RepID=A0A3Q3WXU8_MOLML
MAEVIELHKLKLAELRQECEARGLETKGNKGELIARLQAYLEEHEEDVDVDDVLAEDTEVMRLRATFSAGSMCSNVNFPLSVEQRLQKRAERFNMPASAESKKAMRAARFGLPAEASSPSPGVLSVNVDQLKKRAERFGMNVSSISQKIEDDEKLKKRKERFGALTNVGSAVAGDVEAKKLKRAERFGIV